MATILRIMLPLALLLLSAPLAAQDLVNLRPIDRATVRVVSLHGLDPASIEGEHTRSRRVVARAATTHGSAVAITPHVLLTARHVIWAADAWAVIPPGSSTPIAAKPIYVDAEHDLAFLWVDGRLPHHIELPATRTLTLSEPVSASGYPLDLREPTPAATSGEVSRVTRSGQLHLSMAVNPGHSGGPVIDADGHLVGIVSARGRIDRGVEGLTVAVPLSAILAGHERLPTERPSFEQYERDLAAGIAWLAGVGDRPLLDDRAQILPLLQRATTWTDANAGRDAIFAALSWNTLIEFLESGNATALTDLPVGDRALAGRLLTTSRQLAERALREGPQVRRRFPVVRAISLGRPSPPAPRSPR